MKEGRGNGNTVRGFKTLAVCKASFLCTVIHTTLPGMGSGCFLAVNTQEEKRENWVRLLGKM